MPYFPISTRRALPALLLSTGLLVQALPPDQPPPPKLVAQPEPQLSLSGQNLVDYEFGRINFLDTPQIAHTFTVRNEGPTPLTITQLQTSCHCTHVTIEEVAGRKNSLAEQSVFVLEPAQDMKIKMTLQLARQVAGRVTQSVYVYADGHNSPVTTLRLICDLEQGITVSPTTLDFGPLKPGETQSRKVTLTYDPRLVGNATLTPLVSQCDPHIAAQTSSPINIVPEKEVPTPTPATTTTLRTQTYTVTVKPSQSGDLAARIYFPNISPTNYCGTVPYDTALEVYRSLTIPVRAQVLEK